MRNPVPAVVAGVSLANLAFLEQWQQVLRVGYPKVGYFVTRLSDANYLAIMFDVMAFGALGAALAISGARSARLPVRLASMSVVAAGFLLAVNAVRRELFARLPLAGLQQLALTSGSVNHIVFAGVAIVAFIALVMFTGSNERVAAAARIVVRRFAFALAPFVVFTFGSSLKTVATGEVTRSFREVAPARVLPRSANVQQRVVIVVFDEADYRLMFESRAIDLRLPNFDRLRRESLFATNAIPPAAHTHLSLPAYLTGRTVSALRPSTARDAWFRFKDDRQWRRFSSRPNLFDAARAAGANVAVAGWSHPYCRLFGRSLTECFMRGLSSPPTDFVRAAVWYAAEALTVGPFLDRAYGFGLPYHTRDYIAVLNASTRMLRSDTGDLVFIHLPVPHDPRIYDRRSRQFVGPQRRHSRDGYIDNLALADVALGALRSAINASPRADSTFLLVTSDHAYRLAPQEGTPYDPRVPFIAHLASSPRPAVLHSPFNTVVLPSVALAALTGRIRSAADLARSIVGE